MTGNVLSQVTRNIPATTARYFRLLITGANSYVGANDRDLSTVTIAEFELYGISAGGSGDPPQEPDAQPVIDEKPDGGDTANSDDPSAEPDGDTSDPGDKTEDETKTPTRRRVVRQSQVSYFPWWGWLLIAGGVLAAGAVVVILILVLRKKRQSKPQA